MGKLLKHAFEYDSEEDFIEQIKKQEFYDSLAFFDVDIQRVFPSKSKAEMCYKENFNFALKRIVELFDCSMIECIVYLNQDYADMRTILNIVDKENLFVLKEELAYKYNIKLPKSILSYFLSY